MLIPVYCDHNEGQVKVLYSKQDKVSMRAPQQRGFTLLEVMITLAIVAILASLAVPAFTRMIRANNVLAASNSLIAAVTLARSEAITRGANVTICATANPAATTPACNTTGTAWETGWLIYLTNQGVTSTSIIKVEMANTSVRITAPGPSVTFDTRGAVAGLVGTASVAVNAVKCDVGKDKKTTVSLSSAGLINSIAEDTVSGDCP